MEYKKAVYDIKTGQETIVPMTKEEIAELKRMQEQAEQEALKGEIAAKERELLELLDRERLDEVLGVTTVEPSKGKGTVQAASDKDGLIAEITQAKAVMEGVK